MSNEDYPLPPCGCEPQCVPGVCRTTCENIDPVCCGLSPDGVPGVCDPTTAECCYPSCTGKSCGADDGCGGKCGCTAPLDCVYDSPGVCAVVADAFVSGQSFFAVAMTTDTGVPVSAQFPVQSQGALYAIVPTECGLVQTPGVNFMTDTLASASVPAQRISYWSAQYFGDGTYALSCVANSLGRAGLPSSGPFYFVDPSQTQLGSLLSSLATDATKLACSLTPIAMPGQSGTFVRVTAPLRSGGVHTLGAVGGQLSWVPGVIMPGTGIYVAWRFGGCTADGDCTGKKAPYCQIGNTCGASPTTYVFAPSTDVDCGTVCSDPSILASTGWDTLGFSATGIYLGGPALPEARSDGKMMCQCQAYSSAAEADSANAMAQNMPRVAGAVRQLSSPVPAQRAALKMLPTEPPRVCAPPSSSSGTVTVPVWGLAMLSTAAAVFLVLLIVFAVLCSQGSGPGHQSFSPHSL